MSTAGENARKLLALGAWALLAAVALGFVSSIPQVDLAIDQASATTSGRVVMGVVFILVGAAALAAWAGALWHVAVTPRSPPARWGLLALLIFWNFVASLFY
jgi:hypothetical protein